MSWWSFFRPGRPSDDQFDAELRFHLERLTEEKIADGLTPQQARRQAVIDFGGREQVKEELRDVHRSAALESLRANLKSGVRSMRKSPSFSAAIVLTLALGIGANSAVFSALNAILLRSLPFPDGDNLMLLQQYDRSAKNPQSPVAPQRLEDWNRQSQTFKAISGWFVSDASETSGALPEKVAMAWVAPRFLQVWGISPSLGRNFAPEEEHFGGPNAVLISDRLWHRRFQADPKAIGKLLRLEKASYSIIGIMPPHFLSSVQDVDVWSPSPPDAPFAQARESTWFTAVGRLQPGVTFARARSELANIQAELGKQFPMSDSKLGVGIQPLKQTLVGKLGRGLWLLFASVSLLLLIACMNVAALLLARTAERSREISVRFSLGASRATVVAQLLTECFVLAVAGSMLGLALAAAGSHWIRTFASSLPRAQEITLDGRILLYTFACAVSATLLCGLFPAIRATRRSIVTDLAQGGRAQVSTRNPWQWLLVGTQVAFAVTLLIGATLLLRTFQELARVAPGFETSHMLTFRISGNWGESVNYRKLTERVDRELDTLRAIPGVRNAATSLFLPGLSGDSQTEIRISEGRSASENKIVADTRVVSHGYFQTMGIALLSGEGCPRSLNNSVVVNRSFAAKYFPQSTAIGHHLEQVSSTWSHGVSRILGVVADAREQGLDQAPLPAIYWCYNAPNPSPWLLVRTQGNAMAMSEIIRRKIRDLEPARSVFDISPLEEHLSESFAESRLRTVLLTLFATTAIVLACVGLFGTLNYFVTVRRREVGLRLALGARRGQIVMEFLTKGFGIALLGCIAGLGIAAWCSRALSGLLYGITTSDPTAWISVVVLLLTVAALASLIPAMRAARLDPMQVLRDE